MARYDELIEAARRQREVSRATNRIHMTAQAEHGRQAAAVLAHPGWQIFVDLLEGLKRDAEKSLASAIAGMTNTIPNSGIVDHLVASRVRVARAQGEIDGLSQALKLIPTLIERGRAADAALGTPPITGGRASHSAGLPLPSARETMSCRSGRPGWLYACDPTGRSPAPGSASMTSMIPWPRRLR